MAWEAALDPRHETAARRRRVLLAGPNRPLLTGALRFLSARVVLNTGLDGRRPFCRVPDREIDDQPSRLVLVVASRLPLYFVHREELLIVRQILLVLLTICSLRIFGILVVVLALEREPQGVLEGSIGNATDHVDVSRSC